MKTNLGKLKLMKHSQKLELIILILTTFDVHCGVMCIMWWNFLLYFSRLWYAFLVLIADMQCVFVRNLWRYSEAFMMITTMMF